MPLQRTDSGTPLRLVSPHIAGTVQPKVTWWPAIATAVVAITYFAFSSIYLLDYPPVYSDEPWLLSGPIHIVMTGHDGLPMFGEHYNIALYYDYYVAAFLKVFGIGLGAARLISAVHGLGLIILVYLIARMFAPRTAWIAPLLLPAIFPFTEASHYVRPDVIATFYGVLGVWLYLFGRDRGPGFLAAAGAAAGFAFGLFIQAVWAVALLAVWAAIDMRRLRRRVAWLAGGAALAIAPFVLFVLDDPHDYGRFTRKFGGSSIFGPPREHVGFATAVWHSLRQEPNRYIAVERWSHDWIYVAALVTLTAVSIVGTLRGHRVWLSWFLLVPLATIAAGGVNKTSLYFVVAAPALAVLSAVFAARGKTALIAILALTLVLTGGYAYNVARLIAPVRTHYRAIERTYRSAYHFPRRSFVVGQPIVYAYYLSDPHIEFRSVHYFTSFSDFNLETAREITKRLDAESQQKHIYLVYDPPSFYTTMEEFDFSHSHLNGLRRLVTTRFEPVADISVHGSAYGDFNATIAKYLSSGQGHG